MSEPGIVREAERLLAMNAGLGIAPVTRDLVAEVRRLEAEYVAAMKTAKTLEIFLKSAEGRAEKAESSLSTLQANFQETHTAWNRENDARHDAEERLSSLVAGVQQLEQKWNRYRQQPTRSFNGDDEKPQRWIDAENRLMDAMLLDLTALRIAVAGGET